VYAIFTRLVTAGSYYTPVGRAAYQHGLANQFGIKLALNRYKKRIEVNMYDMTFEFHITNMENLFLNTKSISIIVSA
jgi:hypothetical protein